jgi:hypothetical protein
VKKGKYPKAKHPQQKADIENNRKTHAQITRHHDIRNWMNLLLIFSGIAVAIAAMLGIFVHFRDGAIWFTWFGVVLAITAAFVWFQGLVWERDSTKPAPTSSIPTAIVPGKPSVIPSPAVLPSAPTSPSGDSPVPTAEKPLPKPTPKHTPSSSTTTLSPREIVLKIKAASFHNRDEVAAAFKGMIVDWELAFGSASRSGVINDRMHTFFTDDNKDPPSYPMIMVICDLPAKGNERLPLMEKTDVFRVKGTIEEADQYGNIRIKKASIELIT